VISFFAALTLSAQPVITLNAAAIDLGPIYHGEIKTVPLIVRNAGTEPLRILGVETSCGCTTAKKSVEAIAPGTVDTITVSFNSLGFSGDITKIVSIHSTDPNHQRVDVRLTGTVVSLLESVPPMQVINFGGSSVGTAASVSLTFRNTTSDPVTIRGISCADPSVKSSFASGVIAPNDSVAILFSYTPPSRTFVENYFYIETTDLRQPRIPFRFMYLGR
jgi:hypothetical protein